MGSLEFGQWTLVVVDRVDVVYTSLRSPCGRGPDCPFVRRPALNRPGPKHPFRGRMGVLETDRVRKVDFGGDLFGWGRGGQLPYRRGNRMGLPVMKVGDTLL